MSDHSDDDSTPRAKPARRWAQPHDERDGAGVARRARTAPLEYAPESIPIEMPDEVTDVHKLVARVASSLRAEEVTPSVIRLTTEIVKVLWGHVNSAERRRANGDLAVAAVHGDENTGRRLTELETRSLVISGEDGNNGRLGNLRGEIKTLRAALIAVALAVLGGAGASAKALYTAGESRGAERAEFVRMQQAVETLSERQDQIRLRVFGIPPAPAGLPGVIP